MNNYREAGNPDDIAVGRKLIAEGKVGCIVLAGGDGSRLDWNGPKGTFPLSLVQHKTLFQMVIEKVEEASRYFAHELKCAIMTSPLNDEESKKALVNKKISFFSQTLAPLLDEEKKPMKEKRSRGNGEALRCFYSSGLFREWKASGIEYLHLIFIDNPLADPFDPNLCGFHHKIGAEATLKAVLRLSLEEKVGAVGEKEGKLCVVEYGENPPSTWRLANTSLFCFSMDFIEKTKNISLPLHLAKKSFEGKIVFKQEYFIFDLLLFAERTGVLIYPREETFAPLKTKEDVKSVQQALLLRDQKAFFHLSGVKPPERVFELDPAFHYPTEQLKKKWKGRTLPEGSYIEP